MNSIGDNGAQSLALMIREKKDYQKLTLVLRSNQVSNTGYEKIKQALIYHMQERNTREVENYDKITLREDIKIQLAGNPIIIKDFQTQLDGLANSFASLLLL